MMILGRRQWRMKLVGEKVLYRQGSFVHVVRWYAGWWPNIPWGVLTYSNLTGQPETRVEMDVIMSIRKFEVKA
jgi:hypothetical protein